MGKEAIIPSCVCFFNLSNYKNLAVCHSFSSLRIKTLVDLCELDHLSKNFGGFLLDPHFVDLGSTP